MSFTYMFPFGEIEKGSKIVLYGGGVCGRSLYEQCKCTNYCEVVLWADERWQQLNNEINKYKLGSIYDIKDKLDEIDYVLIAIHDETTANSVRKLIREIGVTEEKIKHYICCVYDDFENKIYIPKVRYQNTLVKNILPKGFKELVSNKLREEKDNKTKKPKIRFAASSLNNIIGFETIAKAFFEDNCYDTNVIVTGNPKGVSKELARKKLPHMFWYDYDIRDDKPDVFFITYGEDYNFLEMNKYTKHVVAIHISIVKWANVPIKQYLKQVKRQFNIAKPDVFIWDKLLYDQFKDNGILEDSFCLIGNPKFDVIYNATRSKRIPEKWKKFEGKKIFLWCTDHVYYCDNITFDIYAKHIIDKMEKNKDVALIFRPHPQFIDELVENRIWSVDDLYFIKKYMEQSDNMVWDDNATYEMAYGCCEAIMVDSECGIVCSSLPLGVPTAALFRPEKEGVAEEEVVSTLYNIRNVSDLDSFFDMVLSGNDPLKKERESLCEKMINHFDGKNGYRIKEFVEEKLLFKDNGRKS